MKILKEDKERQARDLGEFFEEVGALDELGTAVEEDEEAVREQTDRAVQMSYMVRLARLYQQADRGTSALDATASASVRVNSNTGQSLPVNGTDETEENILGVVLPDAAPADISTTTASSEMGTGANKSSKSAADKRADPTLGADDDVFSVMKRQRLERKKLREMARGDDSANNASAVQDWTAKSI